MLSFWLRLLLLAGLVADAEGKSVFAHFMVGNTAKFTKNDWVEQMSTAQGVGIDAFALNIAYNQPVNDAAIPLAFEAAGVLNFKLFFSLDYAGGDSPWPADTVQKLVSAWSSNAAYFQYNSKPLVSTFEGPGSMDDWRTLKTSLNCFFLPDWSSLGAKVAAAPGIADGLFSWDAWPKGTQNMTTYSDASYNLFLKGLPYMMPVSPWFYTNMPGYNKNWLWRGDSLWFDRWQQIISIDNAPDLVEIISWNDFGESHYVGPLDSTEYDAFEVGKAPYNYVEGKPHDGWLELLPYYISMYKTGTAQIQQEVLVSWYRQHLLGTCDNGGTTGDTATQLNLEYDPEQLLTDRVYFDAVLTEPAEATISIGGTTQKIEQAQWDYIPHGGVGVYHGSVPINGATGPVTVSITRNGATVLTMAGANIGIDCEAGKYNNYNAWVGKSLGPTLAMAVSTGDNLSDLQCIRGTGTNEFVDICRFVCANGYCPSSACVCLAKGKPTLPKALNVNGYPAQGQTMILEGLCSFACNYGFCPSDLCGSTPNNGTVPTFSPFLPPACVAGTGANAFAGLCTFGCNYGFCPMHACQCTETGLLVDAPARTGKTGKTKDGSDDYGLCDFAARHGYSPLPDLCEFDGDENPHVPAQCTPPCQLVFPPSTLANPSTISLAPYTTSLEIDSTSTTTITVVLPVLTVTEMSYFNWIISPGQIPPSTIIPYESIPVPPVTTVIDGQTRTLGLPPWPLITKGPPDGTSASSSSRPTAVPLPDITADTNPVTLPSTTKPPYSVVATQQVPLWPVSGVIKPLSDPVPEGGSTDDNGSETPCTLWFLSTCISWPGPFNINIQGWNWQLPQGVWGPGPSPPGIELPPGMVIEGTLPPWPKITVHPGGSIEAPPKPTDCKPTSASLCMTVSAFATTTQAGGAVVTTATSTTATCATIEGCDLSDVATTITTDACTLKARDLEQPQATVSPTKRGRRTSKSLLTARAEPDWSCEDGASNGYGIIWLQTPDDSVAAAHVRSVLQARHDTNGRGWVESRADDLGVTAFFTVFSMGKMAYDYFNSDEMPNVYGAYWPFGSDLHSTLPSRRRRQEGSQGGEEYDNDNNSTMSPPLSKRELVYQSTPLWHLSQVTWPEFGPFFDLGFAPHHDPANGQFAESWDDSRGYGQTIYVLDTAIAPSDEWGGRLTSLTDSIFGDYIVNLATSSHGFNVMAVAGGGVYGVAQRANLVFSKTALGTAEWVPMEADLEGFIRVANHAATIPHNTCVVNLSFAYPQWRSVNEGFFTIMTRLMQLMTERYGCIFVVSAGNFGADVTMYPANAVNSVDGMIVVGAVDQHGQAFSENSEIDLINALAPGVDVPGPDGAMLTGTSFASPIVAGMVAYFRGLPYYPGSRDPASIRNMIRQSSRVIPTSSFDTHLEIIWNGMDFNTMCDMPSAKRAEAGGSGSSGACSLLSPNNGGSGGSDDSQEPRGSPISFQTGTPGPICSSDCGTACSGFYCDPTATPTGNPPDFTPPASTLDPGLPTTTSSPSATPSPPSPSPSNASEYKYTPPDDFPKPVDPTTLGGQVSCGTCKGVLSPAGASCGSCDGQSLVYSICDNVARQYFLTQADVQYNIKAGDSKSWCLTGLDPSTAYSTFCTISISNTGPDNSQARVSGSTALAWYTTLMNVFGDDCRNCGTFYTTDRAQGQGGTSMQVSASADGCS